MYTGPLPVVMALVEVLDPQPFDISATSPLGIYNPFTPDRRVTLPQGYIDRQRENAEEAAVRILHDQVGLMTSSSRWAPFITRAIDDRLIIVMQLDYPVYFSALREAFTPNALAVDIALVGLSCEPTQPVDKEVCTLLRLRKAIY